MNDTNIEGHETEKRQADPAHRVQDDHGNYLLGELSGQHRVTRFGRQWLPAL